MGNRRRHIGSSLAALTLTLSLLTGLLTGCGPGGSQSSSPEAGSTPPAASQSTQTPEQPALPELTTDTYGNAAVGYQAAVVSANEYTSRIGMDILEAGGNAVDAAVAMIFANSLTEPGATSLGGASFMTIYLKETGEYICIEAMETAPAAAGIDTLDEINEKKGAMLVTVPGQVHGALTALEKYGTMTREEVLAPVIQLAEEGFDVHISFEERASASFDKLVQNEEAAKIFTNEGLPYAVGDHFTNPDYADTLRKIAEGGIDEFYKGSIAQTIVDEVQRLGGLLTMEDMASYTSVEREPISTTYHGYEIVTQGPPSNGGAPMLEMFNILENYDLVSMGFNTPEYLFTFNEALRLSMADGITYFGDPDFYELPIDTLISKEYAKELQRMGARNVVVSLGEKGALLLEESGRCLGCRSPRGQAVSTVGAGDSLVAGFLYGCQLHGTLEGGLKWGVAAGAATAFQEGIATGSQVKAQFPAVGNPHPL